MAKKNKPVDFDANGNPSQDLPEAPAPAITEAEFIKHMANPAWRLSHLYKIVGKGDDGDERVVTFKPNRAQRRLAARLHHRNVIPKARQLGMTTFIAILWLDTAIFSKDALYCGVIAHTGDAVREIFRGKVLFAYNRLPDFVRAMAPLAKKTETEIVFGHNDSVVKVATSLRSGTIHRLHVSELGKIAAKYPQKAREVQTGSIPAVPKSGMLVVESTAEGQAGLFYDIVQNALATQQSGRPLSTRDYKLHFFAWWEASEYRMPVVWITLNDADHAYFAKVEARIGRKLDPEQKAWYVATLRNDFAGERPLMWQEYPSYVEEAFQVSTEGCYYAVQLIKAREQGRILPVLNFEPGYPVNTFWDIGLNDNMAIWLHQHVGGQDRFIKFYKNSGEPLAHYSRRLTEMANEHDITYGTHFLPHDANARRLGENEDTNRTVKEMLESMRPGERFEAVPRVTTVIAGIQATRMGFANSWFNEAGTSEGLTDLGTYRKEWDERRGTWKDHPFHGPESDSADAFRQFGQARDSGLLATALRANGQRAVATRRALLKGSQIAGSGWRRRYGGSAMKS